MAEPERSTGRIRRATRLAGVAAGHGARTVGTRTANLVRSEEQAQAALGRRHIETAERIVTVLATMKGAAMKIGQTFSVLDVGMVPPEYREQFQAKLALLQQGAEPAPFKDIRKVVEQDLGARLAAVFADFSEQPVAAASIGQVHRATLKEDGRDVAVKVQYPGIKEAVRADMQNLGIILKLLARISPGLDTREIADEIRGRITEELDYELEASNHRAMARKYRGHPFVVVPDVVTELCRERVIVTDFVEGRRFEDIRRSAPQEEKNRLAEILMRFYVNGPFRHRLLNGDPHPGNSLFLPDGRVAFVDFGFFKTLTGDETGVQLDLLRAVSEERWDRLMEIMVEQRVITSVTPEATEAFVSLYVNLCGWFTRDEVVTITPDIATNALVEQSSWRRRSVGDVRMPADQVVAARAYMLVLAILGQLEATNNWHHIARETIYGEQPVTELGRIELAHHGASA